MVADEAREKNEALRWLQRRIASDQLLERLRERAPEKVTELKPRRRTRTATSPTARPAAAAPEAC